MNLRTEKSIALLTVILVVFVLVMLSSVMIALLSNQTRLVEHGISRTKSKYANEAAMVSTLERLRRQDPWEGTHSVSGRYDDDAIDWLVNITNSSAGGLTAIDLSVDYAPSF
ncbi:hypothetical protein ACFL2Y_03425 [Candidatus Omnitrophota bacterium]